MSRKREKKINASMQLPSSSGDARPQPSPMHRPVALSFKLCDAGAQFCLSHCETDEVRATVDCFRKLNSLELIQVLQQGGKQGNKTGLAYTPYPDDALKGVTKPGISPDVRVASVRANQKMRIFGCMLEHTFFVLWFDRNHEIVPV
jgi:hypothetical protein